MSLLGVFGVDCGVRVGWWFDISVLVLEVVGLVSGVVCAICCLIVVC